jgi:kynurenine formamidase
MKLIDLTLPIDTAMRGVDVRSAKTISNEGWNATTLELYSHCGTHMDAPFHFVTGGATLDQQDLSVCVGPALLVDLTLSGPVNPGELITVGHLKRYHDQITPGVRLLLKTDWHKRYPSPEYRDQLPRISNDLATWLVDRKVAMIGVEPPSVANVNDIQELTQVHQTLFNGGVLIVEGLANLDQITESVVQFIALPMKIVGGDGSPVRAIAIQDR